MKHAPVWILFILAAFCLPACTATPRWKKQSLEPPKRLPIREAAALETTLGSVDGVVSAENFVQLRIPLGLERRRERIARCVALPPGGQPRIQAASVRLRQIEPWDGEVLDAETSMKILNEAVGNGRALVTLASCGIARRSHLYSISINPDVADAKNNHRYWLVEVDVRIEWGAAWSPAPVSDSAYAQTDNPWWRTLAHLVANPSALRAYADGAPPAAPVALACPVGAWRLPAADSGTNAAAAAGTGWLKLNVAEEGLVYLDYDTLKEAGWDPAKINPARLRAYCEGNEVPMLLLGGYSSRFTIQDRVLFWSRKTSSPAARENVYYLGMGPEGETPARMESIIAPEPNPKTALDEWTSTQRIEEDNALHCIEGEFLSIRGMKWIWAEMATTETMKISFDLPEHHLEPADPAESCRVRIILCTAQGTLYDADGKVTSRPGAGAPSGSFEMALNGKVRKTFSIAGRRDEFTAEFDVAPGDLLEKGNEAELTWKPSDPKTKIYLDAIEVRYPHGLRLGEKGLMLDLAEKSVKGLVGFRMQLAEPGELIALDLTDSKKPRVLPLWPSPQTGEALMTVSTDKTFRAAVFNLKHIKPSIPRQAGPGGDPRAACAGADAVIVYHASLEKAAREMEEIWRASGFHPQAVNVENLYDFYSAGLTDPAAVRQFLTDLAANGGSEGQGEGKGGGPYAALLVGDCTSDARGLARNNIINMVPSFTQRAQRDSTQESFASDHWFATILGDDDLADLLVGRISAVSSDDALNVVDKARKAREFKAQSWGNAAGLVADNGLDFYKACEEIRKSVLPPQTLARLVYLPRLPFEDNFYLPPEATEGTVSKVSPITTRKIESLFDEGCAVIGYFGHGSPNIWSDWRIWFGGDSPNNDSQRLSNSPRFPLVFNGTCNSGAIDYPLPRWNICIAEDMMRHERGGALACFVPSGPGFTSNHLALSRALFRAAYALELRQTGPLCETARLSYQMQYPADDHARMFILLGDPLALLAPAIRPGAEPLDLTIANAAPAGSSLLAAAAPAAVSLSAAAPRNAMQSGRSWAAWNLLDEKGEIVSSQSGADASMSYSLPKGAEGGNATYKVIGYFGAPESAVAGGVLPEGRARKKTTEMEPLVLEGQFDMEPAHVAIRQPRFAMAQGTPPPPDAASRPMLLVPAENRSDTKARGQILVERLAGDGASEPKAACPPFAFELDPQTERTFAIEVDAPAGLNIFQARLAGEDGSKKGNTLQAKSAAKSAGAEKPGCLADPSVPAPPPVPLVVPQTGVRRDVVLRLQSLEPVVGAGVWPVYARVSMVIGNVGSESWPANATVRLVDDQSRILDSRPLSAPVAPGAYSQCVLGAPWPQGRNEAQWTVEIAPGTGPITWVDEHPENNRIQVKARGADAPNAAFVMNSLVANPASPMEGETVFFEARVRNVGGGAIPRIRVGGKAFDAQGHETPMESLSVVEPDNAISLPNFGEIRTIRLRWDATANLGVRRVALVLDPDGEVPDSDRSNNRIQIPFGIRTKWKLVPKGIVIAGRQGDILTIVARIRNEGQSPARHVIVAFYPDPTPDRAKLLGETVRERIDPGEIADIVLKWQIPREYMGKKIQPSFEAYLKGSQLRVSSASD